MFDELVEAFDELKQWKEGKITLKTYKVEQTTKPEVTPALIRDTRERLNLSRPVFAHELFVAISTKKYSPSYSGIGSYSHTIRRNSSPCFR